MRRLACGGAVLLTAVLALPHCVRAQDSPATGSSAATALLTMPFVPQSEALCGGAALAMVLRHHGVRGVQSEDFAHLVTDAGTGILTTDLTEAAERRGLQATPFTGSRDVVQAQLAAGVPVIALIEDRPGTYHYVVLLAWGDDRVLFHDPAVGPHQVMDEAAFMRAWQSAEFWALLTTRAAGGRAADSAVAADEGGAAVVSTLEAQTCSTHIRDAASAASMNDLAAAERLLQFASRVCADSTVVVRERAGLRFRQQRYDEAEADALLRLSQAPDDTYAWNLLGASRFVQGERGTALDAWNRIGRPHNDLVHIQGLRRTPYRVVSDAVAIEPGGVVTAAALAHARRRTAALPAIARSRVDYHPISGDSVEVRVAVLEHPLLPSVPLAVAVHVVRAVSEQRVLVQPANLLRLGERWRLDGTWQGNRRALAVGVSVPRVLGMNAITHLDAGVRDRTFAEPAADGAPLVRETRRRAALMLTDWASAAVEWHGGVAADEWDAIGAFGSAFAGGALHLAGDRVVLRADATGWWSPDADAFGRVRIDAGLLTSPARRTDILLQAHGALTSAAAPLSAWNGAGTGRTSRALLRAHPLLDGAGIIRSQWWAPRLMAASLEVRQWLLTIGPVDVGAAAFIDGARAGGGMAGVDPEAGADARGAVDGGAGLRLRVAGGPLVRIDGRHRLEVRFPRAQDRPVDRAGRRALRCPRQQHDCQSRATHTTLAEQPSHSIKAP